MSDGENVPPVPIENRIKNEIPFLSNVIVVGDQREFLTCLMTLKVQSIVHAHRNTRARATNQYQWFYKQVGYYSTNSFWGILT